MTEKNSVHETYLQRLLSRGAYTRAVLRRKLMTRDCTEDQAETLLDRYQELGLIDDRIYAFLFVEGHSEWSIRRISDGLREKGVDRHLVQEVLDEAGIDEVRRAEDLVKSWRPSLDDRRIIGRLDRRGFPNSVIFKAMKEEEV